MQSLERLILLTFSLATALFAYYLHASFDGMVSGPLDPPTIDWPRLWRIAAVFTPLVIVPGTSLLWAWGRTLDLASMRRSQHNECIQCANPLDKLNTCPECGTSPSRPPPSRALRSPLTYVALSLPLVLLAQFAAELTVISDERAFRAEVRAAQASGLTRYGRARAWPNELSSLMWSTDRGFWCTD